MDNFWVVVNEQLKELESAKTADDVIRILAHERNPYGFDSSASGADAFFAGSGDTVEESLEEAGWRYLWVEANYHYAMRAPDGKSEITYVEGDIYRGNRR